MLRSRVRAIRSACTHRIPFAVLREWLERRAVERAGPRRRKAKRQRQQQFAWSFGFSPSVARNLHSAFDCTPNQAAELINRISDGSEQQHLCNTETSHVT